MTTTRTAELVIPFVEQMYEDVGRETLERVADEDWRYECERKGWTVDGEPRVRWYHSPAYDDIHTGRTVGPFWLRRYEFDVIV